MRRMRKRPGWRRTRSKNYIFAVLAVFALLFSGVAGMSIAYLVHQAGLINRFAVAEVKASVEENFRPEQGEKADVCIRNESSVPVYVRAAVSVWWEDAAGSVLWGIPAAGTDYEITWNLSDQPAAGWVRGTDGFYYYTNSLEPADASDGQNRTEDLISSCKEINADTHREEGKYLVVDIAAQVIQADPPRAVTEAWGSESGGSVSSVSADGGLEILEAAASENSEILTDSTGGEEDAP